MDQAGADLDRELYATIKGYIGAFQVCVPPARTNVTPCFSVFKRKSRRELRAPAQLPPELDATDATRARHSCARCRRLKRRCSRDLPECTNCVASEGVCVYRAKASRLLVSRPARAGKATPTAAPGTAAAPGADSPGTISQPTANEAANSGPATATPMATGPRSAAPTLPSIAYILGIPSLHNT